jgi:ElaB/YqjD/DUF883 family membrane-anchored ribosome-binding protein
MEVFAKENSQAAEKESTELRENSRKALFPQKQSLENLKGKVQEGKAGKLKQGH